MELALTAAAPPVRVIEDCLNGRRTVWEDPFKPGRNGLIGLAQRIEIHSPAGAGHPDAGHQRLSIHASAHRAACGAGHRRPRGRHSAGAHRARHAGSADPDRRAAADRHPARPDRAPIHRRRGEIGGPCRGLQAAARSSAATSSMQAPSRRRARSTASISMPTNTSVWGGPRRLRAPAWPRCGMRRIVASAALARGSLPMLARLDPERAHDLGVGGPASDAAAVAVAPRVPRSWRCAAWV